MPPTLLLWSFSSPGERYTIPIILNYNLNRIVHCNLVIRNVAVMCKTLTGCSDTKGARAGHGEAQ